MHDHAGTNTAVLPLYMTEIPPVSLRGSVGLCHQLGITGAILLSQILGLSYVSHALHDDDQGLATAV